MRKDYIKICGNTILFINRERIQLSKINENCDKYELYSENINMYLEGRYDEMCTQESYTCLVISVDNKECLLINKRQDDIELDDLYESHISEELEDKLYNTFIDFLKSNDTESIRIKHVDHDEMVFIHNNKTYIISSYLDDVEELYTKEIYRIFLNKEVNQTMKNLIGATILSATTHYNDNLLYIETDKGTMRFYHDQECCESVWLEDGLEDLEKMLHAEVIENYDEDALNEYDYSYTWTYYKISTLNHDCTLRFYGTSNGCYSEDVDIEWDGSDEGYQ